MVTLPNELIEQMVRGHVVVFLGDRLLRTRTDHVLMDEWVQTLTERCEIHDSRLTFANVAQVYEHQYGRHALIQFLRDSLNEIRDEPQPVHHLLASLQSCRIFVTTGIDRCLEQAFAARQRRLDVVARPVDIAFETDEQHATLYKLYGSIEQVESLILTCDDMLHFFDDHTSISIVLQGYLARRTILFIGYDMASTDIQRLYRKVTRSFDRYARRSYAFFTEKPSLVVSLWCKRNSVEKIVGDDVALLQNLVERVAQRLTPEPPPHTTATPITTPLPLPDYPYKLLDYYEARDAHLFFARQQEIDTLCWYIHIHRLVLLYGASGVGKTSLLLAGVIPRLEAADPPYRAIYVRVLHDDPLQVLYRALQRQIASIRQIDDTHDQRMSMVDLVHAGTKGQSYTLMLVFDQFEEFFIRFGSTLRAQFFKELGALHDARDLHVKIVIAIREDRLAAMNELEQRIPDMFRNQLRLLPFTRVQAYQAITAPVERLGITYDPDLVDRLLIDLMEKPLDTITRQDEIAGEIMPPQLQLVCHALYHALQPGERMITLPLYEHLGGARGILQQYLDDALAMLAHEEREIAQQVLEELVSSQKTRAVKSARDLAIALGSDVTRLMAVLEKLVHARLLRALDHEHGDVLYELAHEYLIREIELGSDTQYRKLIEELIHQEVENWQRLGTLMGKDRLILVNNVRESLRLSPEAQELLMRSAFHWGYEFAYWLGRVSDSERRVAVLTEATSNGLPAVQLRVEMLLGAMGSTPEHAVQLAGILIRWLSDDDWRVRMSVARALRRMNLTSVEVVPFVVAALVGRLEDLYWEVRHHTVVALEHVAAANDAVAQLAYPPLRKRLHDEHREVRASAVSALAHIGMACPTVMTSDIADELVQSLNDDDWLVRASAAIALEQVAMMSEALATQIAIVLITWLGEHGYHVYESTILAIGSVGVALVAHHAPLSIIDQIVEVLALQGTHDDVEIRSHAATAMGNLGATTQDLAMKVIPWLLNQLTDEESFVRASVAAALGQVGLASYDVAYHIVQMLGERLRSERWQTREWTVIALAYVGEANGDMALHVVGALIRCLTDEDWHVCARTITALVQVLTSGAMHNVLTIQPDGAAVVTMAITALLERLDDAHEQEIIADNAATALGEIAQSFGYLVTQSAATEPHGSTLAIAAITEQRKRIVAALIRRLMSESRDSRARTVVILGKLALTCADTLPVITSALGARLADPASFVRFRVAETLGQIYAHQVLQAGGACDLLFQKFNESTHPHERTVIARAIFFVALHSDHQRQAIRAQLEDLAASHQRTHRVWVNVTLQMIDIADLANAAIREPSQRKMIEQNLDRFKLPNLFDSDITWAAHKALEWIGEQSEQTTDYRLATFS